jgi:hypothetical protein
MYGFEIPDPTVAPFGTPGQTFECLSCHVQIDEPPELLIERNCTVCHGSDCCDGSVALEIEQCNPNEPPDCSQSSASIAELWPPNHKYVDIEIMGVTDPDGDPVTITIDAITQDEEVNAKGKGDGNTAPDGTGIGTDTASVRAERQGKGNGRVYEISFTAVDDKGAECSGAVQVCVPHDQRPGHVCVDDGQNYDSTVE